MLFEIGKEGEANLNLVNGTQMEISINNNNIIN